MTLPLEIPRILNASFPAGWLTCFGKGLAMKKSKFTEEQIAFALRQGDIGTPVAEVCRKMGVAEATYF